MPGADGVSVLVDGLGSPEGPDVLPDGRVVFVETFRCRVSAWSPATGLEEYADTGGAPNACMRGLDGVYIAENGCTAGPWVSPRPNTPSIQRAGDDGSQIVLTETASGEPLLGPNDLTFGPDGSLFFTDPGIFDATAPEHGRICRLAPDGTAEILEEVGPTYPNGIVAEPDGGIVWNESFSRRVRRRTPGGMIETLATLPEDRILDGMKISEDGVLYITGVTSGGIDLLAPDGTVLGFVATGGAPLNCVFRGTELLITDFGDGGPESGRLTAVDVGVRGMELFRGSFPSI